MKSNNFNWKILMMGIGMAGAMAACNGNEKTGADNTAADGVGAPAPTPSPAEAEEAMQGVEVPNAFLASYMEVKDALFNDEQAKAKEEAGDLLQNVDQLEAMSEQQKQEIENAARQLADAGDIQAQRAAFQTLSNKLYQVGQDHDISNKTLYWQHCPMAMDNAGANWLSFSEEIQNPYMGQDMPKCGSVQETLE